MTKISTLKANLSAVFALYIALAINSVKYYNILYIINAVSQTGVQHLVCNRRMLMKRAFAAVLDYVRGTDKFLWLICALLSGTGITLLYSICHNGLVPSYKIFYVQIAATVLGIALACVISKIDYHTIAALWKIFVPISIILVLLTFTPLGVVREGSDDRAWIDLGITYFQPSEVLKIAFVFTLAMHISRLGKDINRIRNLILVCVHGAIPVMLIMIQGDYGSALIFLGIFVFMLFAGGLSWKYIAAGFGTLAVLGTVFYAFFLPEYHKNRIRIAFNPELDAMNMGFQQVQGKIGLGSGGILGKGLFTNDIMDTIPEVYNDFIFSYVGQTLGLVGCVAVTFLLVLLCVKILMTGKASNDSLGMLICVGIFSMFIIQSVINIGMVLCVMPVIGVTLPFVSYGGTSVVTMYVSIGIVMSVYMNGIRKTDFNY